MHSSVTPRLFLVFLRLPGPVKPATATPCYLIIPTLMLGCDPSRPEFQRAADRRAHEREQLAKTLSEDP